MFLADVMTEWSQRPGEFQEVVKDVLNDSTTDYEEMLAYFEEHGQHGGREVCLECAALVVADGGALAAASENGRIEITKLAQLGTLELMVTDATAAFPNGFRGQPVSALHVLGFEEGAGLFGMEKQVVMLPVEMRTRLPVVDFDDRRLIFAKKRSGEWLLPQSSEGRRLVLLAEVEQPYEPDAIDSTLQGATAVLSATGSAATGAADAAWSAGEASVDGLSYVATATSDNIVLPAWEASVSGVSYARDACSDYLVSPIVDATSACIGPYVSAPLNSGKYYINKTGGAAYAVGETVYQGGEATVGAVGSVLGVTAATVGPVVTPVWEATSETVAPVVAPVGEALEESAAIVAEVVGPKLEMVKEAVAPLATPVYETTAWVLNGTLSATHDAAVWVGGKVAGAFSIEEEGTSAGSGVPPAQAGAAPS